MYKSLPRFLLLPSYEKGARCYDKVERVDVAIQMATTTAPRFFYFHIDSGACPLRIFSSFIIIIGGPVLSGQPIASGGLSPRPLQQILLF